MQNLNKEEIAKKYLLKQEEIDDITRMIISTITYNKIPSESPLAIVVGGQPGAGKSALINFTNKISNTRKFVSIDNDFFRDFHPKAAEIKENYPDLFTYATDQLGMGITSNVLAYMVNNNYDIIFHQTLKNSRIGDDAIKQFKDFGYTVGVRVFAVPFYESSISQCERYLAQAEKLGYCRYATKLGHTTAYLGVPKTVEYLENNGLFDFIQVYKRSNDIANPTLVYTNFNEDTKQQTLKTLSNCENAPYETNKNGFENAKEAVIKTRCASAIKVSKNIVDRIEKCENNPYLNQEIKERLDELNTALTIVDKNQTIPEQIETVKATFENTPDNETNEYLDSIEQSYSRREYLETQNYSAISTPQQKTDDPSALDILKSTLCNVTPEES